MARETSLWGWLKKSRKQLGGALHINRIENSAGAGMPDVEGHRPVVAGWDGGQFWFELKTAPRPARWDTPIRFKVRPAQVPWNNKRWHVGGRNFWLLQVGHGHDRRIYMLRGCDGARIKAGLAECDLQLLAINEEHNPRRFTPADFIKLALTCPRPPGILIPMDGEAGND